MEKRFSFDEENNDFSRKKASSNRGRSNRGSILIRYGIVKKESHAKMVYIGILVAALFYFVFSTLFKDDIAGDLPPRNTPANFEL
jgi:hypothetical protein